MPVVSTALTGLCVPQLSDLVLQGTLYVADAGTGQVVAYDSTDTLPDIVHASTDRLPVDDELLAGLREDLEARGAFDGEADSIAQVLNRVGLPDGLLPAWHSILGDGTGRIWLLTADCHRLLSSSTHRWHEWQVYSLFDRSIARVRLPLEAQLLSALWPRVALVRRDSLGVEHLEVYDLHSADDPN